MPPPKVQIPSPDREEGDENRKPGKNMKLQILKENQIDETLDTAIKQSLARCFPDIEDIFLQTRAYRNNVSLYTVILQQKDIVCAHLAVVERTITAGSDKYLVAGVANVCVLPEYRGKGFSDKILQAAAEEAKKYDFDFGLLFTNKKIKYIYARNGWREIQGQKFLCTDEGKKLEVSSAKMYYPLKCENFPSGIIDLQGKGW
ncbi:MAG: GNAT family N-acetyltransferase [Sedimentisphaerales bacterium]|nr:GNAT family N-acetyltransferase [Sedimentisphaerales bacterium]